MNTRTARLLRRVSSILGERNARARKRAWTRAPWTDRTHWRQMLATMVREADLPVE